MITFRTFAPLYIVSLMCWMVGCGETEDPYNPCESPRRIAFIKPGLGSLDWMPYFGKPNLVFESSARSQMFVLTALQVLSENPMDSFYIPCLEDASQNRILWYSTGTYTTIITNSDPNAEIQYFKMSAYNLLDEPFSNYETIRTADLFLVSVGIKQLNGSILETGVLHFTIKNNNTISSLPTPSLHPSLLLGPREFFQVYVNEIEVEGFNVYYNQKQGLIGFKYQNELFYLQ